jgi:hypothetical protein
MATLDTSSASAILKEYYSNQRVEQLTYQDAPLYAMLKKIKDFEGSSYPLPMRVSDPQGASSAFANAQAQKQPSNYKKFSLTRVKGYSLASIETEAMLASKSNPGAFLQLATAEIDGAIHTMKRRMGWSIYGDGSGALGSVSSVSSANPEVITLSNADDIVKFEVGQTIQARLGGTTRLFATGVSSAVITKVDRDAGTITLGAVDNSGNTDTIVGGDTLNVVGDYNAMLSGLAAWVPASAPSSSPFFGVDRTIDSTRLGGVRVVSTGKPLDEALIDAARRLGREGLGKLDCVFTGFSKYAALEKTLGAKIRYKDTEVAGISFRAIEVSGPSGTLAVYPDRDCPDNRMYMLDMSSWGLYSLGEPVRILDQDGNKMLRESTADSLEVRIGGYFQAGCTSPGANAVLTF